MKEMDEELHIEMHRLVDELGKFSIHMTIRPNKVMSKEACEEFVRTLLEQITKECFNDGADLVGHIKAFLSSEHGTTLAASLIHHQMPVNITNALDARGLSVGDMTVHVIVHGIWDDTVKHASMESIEKVLPTYGIQYEVLKDYYETEKGIAHHK
ncbi:MAG: hypothetical protein HPY73_06535 [Methanomassiliicoccales archaeon]|nr:MAG: hypothetical protein HPY73_06535 [Methanomassiliicoccales archaeon]